jgi:hypothetical protein
MAINQFLPFAVGPDNAVVPQTEYAGAVWRTAGWRAGILYHQQLNKAIRQSSVMASAIAQLVSDLTGDVFDDGDVAALVVKVKQALSGRLAYDPLGTYDPNTIGRGIQDAASAAAGLPSQAGNNGRFLRTDGTNPAWADPPSAGTGGMPTVKDAPFNAVGNGTTADQAAFTAAAAAHPQLRIPPGTYRFSANTSIPAAMALDAGAILAPDAGVTLTIVGQFKAVRRSCLAGAGTVVFAPGSVDFVCAEWFGLSTSASESVNNAALLKAWVAAFGSGLTVGRGAFPLGDVELKAFALSNTSQLPSFFMGVGADGNGGGGNASANVGTSFFGPSARIHFNNDSSTNHDAKILVSGFHVVGPNDNVAGVSGVKFTKVSNFVVQDMQATGGRGYGCELDRCYGIIVQKNTFLSNRLDGILINRQFNQSILRGNKTIGNVKVYTGIHGNIRFAGGPGFESLGPVIEANDTSYAGANAVLYKRTNPSPSAQSITLLSVTVVGTTATATTSDPHGRSTGDLISLFGCSSNPSLNTFFTPAITVTSATTFTWTTSATAGTFTDANMVIGPAAYGGVYNDLRGAILTHYAEDCIGLAAYVGANVRASALTGGYNQGVNSASGGNGVILLDDPTGFRVSALNLMGANSILRVATSNRKHGVNIESTVTTENGAQIQFGEIQMRDGHYYSAAVPTGAGWAQGDQVRNLNAAPGGPVDWYCSSASPLVFTPRDGSGGGGSSLPSQTGQGGKFLRTDGTNTLWADIPTLPSQAGQGGRVLSTDGFAPIWIALPAGGLPPQTGLNGRFLFTNGSNPFWGLPTALSDLSPNMGSFNAGSISTNGNISTTGTMSTTTLSVGAGGAVFSGAVNFGSAVSMSNIPGIAFNITAGSGSNGMRIATQGSGAALTLDASSGGISLYAIGAIRIDSPSQTGPSLASTSFLGTKPGAPTNGEWFPVTKDGRPGHMPWWPLT